MTSKKASEKKRRPGRPKIGKGGRTPIRAIRFRDDDWKLLVRAAKKSDNKPAGTYVREKALEAARKDLGIPEPDKNASTT
jgi:hypothetical protein